MATNSNYTRLKDKWVERHRNLSTALWSKHKDSLDWLSRRAKELAVGTVAVSLLLGGSPNKPTINSVQAQSYQTVQEIGSQNFLISDLSSILPKEIRELTPTEEEKVANTLSQNFGISARAEIDGKRLNKSYGLIGQEQHLALFPGDNISVHFDSQDDTQKYASEGMAPGRGAWGYFAYSQAELTQEDKLREKYYIAVPTFLSENFNSRFSEYRDFFKYRKMLVVNPQNGKAIVADIADSGPSVWTGKDLGGSPEVMKYLDRVDRTPVLYFFIDDSGNKVPLGPINLVQ